MPSILLSDSNWDISSDNQENWFVDCRALHDRKTEREPSGAGRRVVRKPTSLALRPAAGGEPPQDGFDFFSENEIENGLRRRSPAVSIGRSSRHTSRREALAS